ncbi:poly-gamma-glutamate synthesis protein (capsule biosynthesis protein) [Salsuginibacillus halophilus]|uniref:Poly-gamma-glutamate synthesis protein (Capsule biosynthesis protein) n=1 Tax=Salsuginibacillus halophilus TaxID=517424 RepID=A0A2P8H3M1_9BACI|nr:CapA family protein [Salsuginibacillus halophilus]PSL40815.1 poly-gamma-glutamate synthesis protein (capsule biosynthesis protein) [Salsuginibacillus halophilus]
MKYVWSAAAAAALLCLGCESSDSKSPNEVSGKSSGLTTAHAESEAIEELQSKEIEPRTSSSETVYEEEEAIHMIFAGDVMFEWSLEDTVAQHGPDYPFEHVSESVQQADYAIANLETAVTDHAQPYEKIYNFQADADHLTGLVNAGFDFVSLANNHTMDYREAGLLDTVESLDEAGLDHAGAGADKSEAYAPHTVELHGKTIKILAFSEVLPSVDWYAGENKPGIASGYQRERVVQKIAAADDSADYVLVYMHWGNEGEHTPEEATRTYAESMVSAGADAVVGTHPHVLQGFEFFDDQPVAYSIGNFLFPDYVEGPTAETGLLHFKLQDGDVAMSFEPWHIDQDQVVDQGEAYQGKVMQFLADHSYGVSINGFDIHPKP